MDFLGLGASLLGGLLGSKNKAPETTQKNEPWSAAKPYLERNLATNQQLQDHYAQNPFNGLQQQGYENLFGDQNNFRQNIAPGLMQFANQGMNSNYQRQRHERPGQAGGYGLLAQQPQQAQQTGLLAPFSVAQSKPYVVGNLNQQNPLYKDPAAQAPAAPAQPQQMDEAERRRLQDLAMQYSGNLNAGFGA